MNGRQRLRPQLFVLDDVNGELRREASDSPRSAQRHSSWRLLTTQPGLQLYTGDGLWTAPFSDRAPGCASRPRTFPMRRTTPASRQPR